MKFLHTLFLAVGCVAVPASPDVGLAPLHSLPLGAETNGGYIVVLKDNAVTSDVLSNLGLGSTVSTTYSTLLKGFAGQVIEVVLELYNSFITNQQNQFNAVTLNLIRANPLVDWVEHDTIASKSVVQQNAPYNLAIASQGHDLEPSQQNVYRYVSPAGRNVGIYVLDTGIRTTNTEFGGRAKDLITYYDTYTDVDGHGTNVAGIAAGTTYGIAKDSIIYNVKVLRDNGTGPTSNIISGLDYSVQNCGKRKCIINMSLGGPVSQAENKAVQAGFNEGILIVAAAGNDNQDACNVSPASSAYAFTVAAINGQYARTNFSNWGSCVNIFAPGYKIKSAGILDDEGTSTMSGTSQAAPAVAGIGAYFLGFKYGLSARDQSSLILEYAQNDLVTDTKGTNNQIANNGFRQGAPA